MNPLPPIGPRKDRFTPELRTFAAALLCMGVIILWGKYFGPKPPVNAPHDNKAAQSGPAVAGGNASSQQAGTTANAAVTPAATMSAAVPANVKAISDSQERTTVVENAVLRVEFSNRGAIVRSFQLKNYKDDSKPQKVLDLVHPQAASYTGGWPFSIVLDDPQMENAANTGLYKVAGDATSLTGPAEVEFTWSDGHLQVIKKFRFDNSYVLNVEMTAMLDGKPLLAGVAWRGGFGDWTVTDPAPVAAVNTFYSENGKLSMFPMKKLEDSPKVGNVWLGGKTFAGIEDRYFTATYMAPLDAQSTPVQTRFWREFHPIQVENKEQPEPIAAVAAATATQPMALRVYVGPKDYDDLKAMHPPLNSLVQFGYLEIIADPLFHAMKWLHKYVPNWGWTIIALTLIINMLLFPLRIASYKTTMKIQRIAPEVKQINERYKKYKINDPRMAEKNKEIMALYSREGINPVGGCIPMLLQMPIWFGLNSALRGAIELRHATWMWVSDLAVKDPFYILPIVVGLSMYLVSKMTPMGATDPQQAQMMKLMPISMSVMFVIFPFSSGLALYILTSSLVGILQQWYLNRTHPLPPPLKPARAK